MQAIPEGTYGWQKVEFSLTTGGGDNFLWGLRLQTAGPTDELWIDDLSVSKVGSTENLIPDPSFETIPTHSETGWYASQTDLKAELLPLLQFAAKNHVAVNLLLNGGYRTSPTQVNNPQDPSRVSFEAYIRALIPLIKDSPALHSICLTNEPRYWSDGEPTDRPAWQTHLQHAYADIQHLNTAYGTHYATFADVPLGPEVDKWKIRQHITSTKGPPASYYDWLAFNDEQFAGWHHRMADRIHQLAPKIPVHAKIEDFLDPGDGIDPGLFAAFSQTQWQRYRGRPVVRCTGVLRVAPIFNLVEEHIVRENATRARNYLWQGAIHGRSASTIWVRERHAEDDLPQKPAVVAAVGKTALDRNRLAKEVTALHAAPTSVAIFHAPLAWTETRCKLRSGRLTSIHKNTDSVQPS